MTITALSNTKTYGSTTSAAATPTVSGLQGSDTVTGLSETYNSKNAGTGKTLSVAAGYSVSDGNSGGNYAVTTASSTAGVITRPPLTITALANTKTYDGTTSAAAAPTVSGLQGGDTVTGLSEAYDTAAIGTGKTLTVSSGYVVNDGNNGGNYAVTTVPNNTGVINALSTANLFLQSMVADGPQAGVNGTAALVVGGQLPVQFTTPAGFLTNGFSGGTFYFAYDTSVFSIPTPVASVLTKSLTPAQSAEINIGSNSVLGQSTGPNGFRVGVSDATVSGTIHRVTVVIGNDSNSTNDVTGSTGGLLFAINLQPLATTLLTNLYLYNSSTLSKTDAIYDKNANSYTLGLPASLTNAAYNASYDFQAGVAANTLPTLSLGGLMNRASGAVMPVPSVAASGGTVTVYANIQNPDPSANALYSWTVALDYDPTRFSLQNPAFGGDLQLGTIETDNNGSAGYGNTWTTGTVNQQNVSPTDEEVLVTAFTSTTTAVTNTYFGSLFSITFHVNTSTAQAGTSSIRLLANTTALGYPQNFATALSGTTADQTITPTIPNSSLNVGITLTGGGGNTATSTTLVSSSPTVTYGNAVTFTAVVSAAATPTAGDVDFIDTSNGNIILGDVATPLSTTATSSTWTFTTTAKTFPYTPGDTIQAAYGPGQGFSGSNASTTQIVNKATLTITAQPSTKTYDGTASAAATPTVVGLVGSDTVTGLSETYDTPATGTGKTLTVSGGLRGQRRQRRQQLRGDQHG